MASTSSTLSSSSARALGACAGRMRSARALGACAPGVDADAFLCDPAFTPQPHVTPRWCVAFRVRCVLCLSLVHCSVAVVCWLLPLFSSSFPHPPRCGQNSYDMDGASSNATLEDGGTSSSNADGAAPSAARLLAWLVINGTAHAAYNGVSFAVLGRVSVATHAVLEAAQR